jgi:hypothetical protein
MAEFLLLFRGPDRHNLNQSPEQMQAVMQRWMNWMGDLTKQGKMVGAQPLENTGKVLQGTKKVITDGPFAEGKEIIGGYLLCKAADINEAIEISKGCPILEFDEGTVEVRPIGQM